MSRVGEIAVSDRDANLQSDAAVVYVDSAVALSIARGRGLPEPCVLRTYSPALLRSLPGGIERADSRLTPQRVDALNKAATAVSEDLCRRFSDPALGGEHHRGLVAGLAVFTTLHIPLLKAASLTDADYERPVTVIQVSGGEPAFQSTYASSLPELLKANARLSVIEIAAEEFSSAPDPRPPAASLRSRLAFAGLSTLAYRLVVRLGSALGWPGPRGSVLLFRENELVKETALALALKGYALHRMDMVELAGTGPVDSGDATTRDIVESVMNRHLVGLLDPRPLQAIVEIFSRTLTAQLARYRTSIPAWRAKLDGASGLRPKIALTNIMPTPEAVALHRVLRERAIPLVSFQHGVTNEINEAATIYRLLEENCAADLAVVFNEEAALLCRANPFRSGDAFTAGLPDDYRRARHGRPDPRYPPIWYVATALYLGNRGLLFEGVTDFDKADHELAIIDRVLNRLTHRVLYKPYPAFRYLDPDPVIERARAAENVTLYEDRSDLRYMISSARVLITSRSFSTPSLCLMSGKPLIHIDIPDQTPLRREAREAFEAGVFLFDAGAPDFHERLRSFLSQPIETIERLYADKAAARDKLIQRFISTGGTGAGRRAAAAIHAMMR